MSGRLCLSSLLVVLVTIVLPWAWAAEDTTADDEKLVQREGVGLEAPALLDFFRKRTLTDADFNRFDKLIEQLGHDEYLKREEASLELTKCGPPVLPLLKKATRHEDAEIRRRAAACIEAIDAGPKGDLPIACAHLLAARGPADTVVPVLLAYVPFADNDEVEQAVLDALVGLNANSAKPNAAYQSALKDGEPSKRGAAAFVLGRAGDKDVRSAVLPLLADKNTRVRFRAVQGLLAARDKTAVSALFDLLVDAPADELGNIDDLLFRLGGEAVPDAPYGDDEASRKKRREAWSAWWRDKKETIDLAKAMEAEALLGLNVVPEMHANKVWECGRDGKPRWTVANLQCPIDAQVLLGGRLLVAELSGGRVTERDHSGKVFWEYKVNTPIYCRRLPNGQTFISTNHRYCIVTREGTEVMAYQPPEKNAFFIHSIQWLRNGHVALLSMGGQIRELDAAGKEVRTITLKGGTSWSGITGTSNGHYLVVNGAGLVQEIDTAGKDVWHLNFMGAVYASRLPNGNTFIVSQNRGLNEVNRDGKTVWSSGGISSALWRGHRR